MSLWYRTLKCKLFTATWINVVLFWTSCVLLVWKYTTSVCLDWHSKPLAFELPSHVSVLYTNILCLVHYLWKVYIISKNLYCSWKWSWYQKTLSQNGLGCRKSEAIEISSTYTTVAKIMFVLNILVSPETVIYFLLTLFIYCCLKAQSDILSITKYTIPRS